MTPNIQILKSYLPEQVVDVVDNWISTYNFNLTITKGRLTKFGDYRAPFKGSTHLITINQNLDKYHFFITLTHEVAHLITWNKFGNRVKPHGQEWKIEYRILLSPFLEQQLFPPVIETALRLHLSSPTASTCSDLNLLKALRENEKGSDFVFLEELPVNTIFKTNNKRYFIKGEKIKKRFRCKEIKTNAIYLFNPLAEVFTIKKELF